MDGLPAPNRSKHRMLLALACLVASAGAGAFEGDVHYGLTRWLASQAGFEPAQAEAIAIADQRAEGGRLEQLELNLEYACTARYPDVALQAQRAHYPAAKPVPAPAADRPVIAGGDAARQALIQLAARLKGKEDVMLGLFGEALNPLQDSWAHQGVPSAPDFGAALACDAALASGHPLARGGPDSHAADLTASWPADAAAMAQATYAELLRYPPIRGRARAPAAWASVAAALPGFIGARSKTDKRAWFVAQGMPDTAFLAGISLPDGPAPGPLAWDGFRFLPLPGNESMQYDAPVEVRHFFDHFLARWLGGDRVEDVVAEVGSQAAAGGASSAGKGAKPPRELVARLKLWKLRDHGAAAALAHAPSPLTATQLREVDRLTRDGQAFTPPMALAAAIYPLQPSGPAPSPLLPYIVRALPVAPGAAQRMIAIARLRHAPYDTVGWVAEQHGARWVLVDMVSSVDL